MNKELSGFFKKYEALAAAAERAFSQVKSKYPDLVRCQQGCTDCCYALFDLSLIEAMYLKYHFDQMISGDLRAEIEEKANAADRRIYRIKKDAYKSVKNGTDENEVVQEMSRERVRCPLLTDADQCLLYPYRPIVCRIYGVPLAIGGKGFTCGKTGFKQGDAYPTINMDTIHSRLIKLSEEFVRAIDSKYDRLFDVLVPVSMALLTEYDDEYLGIPNKKEEKGD